MKTILIAFCLFYSLSAWSLNKLVSVPINTGDQLSIKGFNGEIQLVDAKTKQLNINVSSRLPSKMSSQSKDYAEDWIFSHKKVGNSIQLEVLSPQSKGAWETVVGDPHGSPYYIIKISGPSLPTTVNWRRGSVKVNGWNSNLKLNAGNGQVSVKNFKADLELSLSRGKVNIENSTGRMKVDMYRGSLELVKVKGKMDLENFTGSTDLVDIDGQVHLTSFKGRANVKSGKGKVNFKMGQTLLKLDKFRGDLAGQSDQGAVVAHLLGDNQVRIKTILAPVSLKMAGSGASVNIGTSKGQLIAPSYLRLKRWPNIKTMTGRLRGSRSGRIYVRSESGNIKIN